MTERREPPENDLEALLRFEDGCIQMKQRRRHREEIGTLGVVREEVVTIRQRVVRFLRIGRREEP